MRGSAELRLHFVACGRSARVTDGRCTAGGGRLDLLSLVKMAQTQTTTQSSHSRSHFAALNGFSVGGHAHRQEPPPPLASKSRRRTLNSRSRLRFRAVSDDEKGKTPGSDDAARKAAVLLLALSTTSMSSVTKPKGPPLKLAVTRVAPRLRLCCAAALAPSDRKAFSSCSVAAGSGTPSGSSHGTIRPAFTALAPLGSVCTHPASFLVQAVGVAPSVSSPRPLMLLPLSISSGNVVVVIGGDGIGGGGGEDPGAPGGANGPLPNHSANGIGGGAGPEAPGAGGAGGAPKKPIRGGGGGGGGGNGPLFLRISCVRSLGGRPNSALIASICALFAASK